MSAKNSLYLSEKSARDCKSVLRSRCRLLAVTLSMSSGEASKHECALKGTGRFDSEVFFTLEFSFFFPLTGVK